MKQTATVGELRVPQVSRTIAAKLGRITGRRGPEPGFPQKAPDLEVISSDAGFVVFQPSRDRVHYLNHTALLVLELANGKNSPRTTATLIQDAYGLTAAPVAEVDAILAEMQRERLVVGRRPSTAQRGR